MNDTSGTFTVVLVQPLINLVKFHATPDYEKHKEMKRAIARVQRGNSVSQRGENPQKVFLALRAHMDQYQRCHILRDNISAGRALVRFIDFGYENVIRLNDVSKQKCRNENFILHCSLLINFDCSLLFLTNF